VNELPPSDTPPDDIDEHYRRASALHLSRPSAALRRAVLSHAADLAAEHAAKQRTADGYSTRPASNRARWRPAIFGGLAAAALAGLLIAPRFLTQRSLLVPPNTPAAASRPDAGPPRSPEREAAAPMPPALEELATSRATTGGSKAAPPNDPAALRQAAEIGDIHKLQMLLEDRVRIDARDAGGRTALMLAVLHGHSDAVDALLAGGADPNAADAHGTTPLQTAVATNQPAVAAALRRAGARAQ
jgi:hypothetical protein